MLFRSSGALSTVVGGVVADGTYGMDFALYANETGGAALWSETTVAVAVKNGGFSYVLGSAKAIPASMAADHDGLWLGVKVGADPELPRRSLGSVAYAMTAQVALGLNCSGCVGAGALDPAVLKDFAKTASLAKVASSGSYAYLTGSPDLSTYAKLEIGRAHV